MEEVQRIKIISLSYLTPTELLKMSIIDQEIASIVLKPEFLNKVAIHNRLPYYDGNTLDNLCSRTNVDRCVLLQDAIFREDIEFLASFTKRDNINNIILYATKYDKINVVRLIIEKNVVDYNIVMIMASMNGSIDIVNMMLGKGATDYNTSMIVAAAHGHINIVKLMLEKGADNYDITLIIATSEQHIDVVKLMISVGAHYSNDVSIENDIISRVYHINDELSALKRCYNCLFREYDNCCMYVKISIDVIKSIIEKDKPVWG